ncbi:MAG: hypothetical protein IKL68_03660 [Clostridia bacterium]|nr:hypothetical protein [Clostridia bacterium]
MEVKERARTRKAIERERKKEIKKAIKAETKRSIKLLVKLIVIITVLLVVFMLTEVIRFNSNFGVPPGIIRGEEYTEDSVTYSGILSLYTITYKYSKPFEEYMYMGNLPNNEIVSGELKLFGKWLISAWIK